jgi:cytochrome bd-type quinol oxidase subunit 2
MRRLKSFFASLVIAASVLVPVTPVLAATNVFDGTCQASGSGQSTACQQNGSDPLTGPNGLLTKVTKIIGYITGAMAIVMVIISGFMYVTSDGDSSKVASARQTMIYALVGVVITVVAQGIVVFVLSKL